MILQLNATLCLNVVSDMTSHKTKNLLDYPCVLSRSIDAVGARIFDMPHKIEIVCPNTRPSNVRSKTRLCQLDCWFKQSLMATAGNDVTFNLIVVCVFCSCCACSQCFYLECSMQDGAIVESRK